MSSGAWVPEHGEYVFTNSATWLESAGCWPCAGCWWWCGRKCWCYGDCHRSRWLVESDTTLQLLEITATRLSNQRYGRGTFHLRYLPILPPIPYAHPLCPYLLLSRESLHFMVEQWFPADKAWRFFGNASTTDYVTLAALPWQVTFHLSEQQWFQCFQWFSLRLPTAESPLGSTSQAQRSHRRSLSFGMKHLNYCGKPKKIQPSSNLSGNAWYQASSMVVFFFLPDVRSPCSQWWPADPSQLQRQAARRIQTAVASAPLGGLRAITGHRWSSL